MIQKNPFLKYVMKDKKEDVFHSSAYAKAQNGASIGVASTESYQVRVNLNQNRTRVRGYDESEVMTGTKANGPRAKKYTPSESLGEIVSAGSTRSVDGVSGASGGINGRPNKGPLNRGTTAATNRAMMPKRMGIKK